jgi:hypothetical protein
MVVDFAKQKIVRWVSKAGVGTPYLWVIFERVFY